MERLEERQLMAVTQTNTFLNLRSGIPVSSTDILNGLVPRPTETNYVRTFEGGPIDNLTDGRTAVTSDNNEFSAQGNAVFSLNVPQHGAFWFATYRLNLDAAPAGYDISSIDSVTGHQDNRTDQTIDIEVQFIGDNNFYSLSNNANFSYRPGLGSGAGKIHLADDAGAPLARGVRAVRFEAEQNAVFRELDVFGTASPVPTSAPAAPTGLTATPIGSDVRISFTDNATNEAAFRIERALVTGGTPGAFTAVATPGASAGTGGTVTFTDNTTVVGQTYQYRVVAQNAFNGGSTSAPVTVNVTTPTTGQGLSAHYYSASRWRGQPVITQIDSNLSDNNWGPGSPHPAVPADNFSAIYSGKFTPAESGSYTFPVQIDDDGFFFLSGNDIGGQSLISDSVQGGGSIALTAGNTYEFVFLGSEDAGNAAFVLNMIKPSGTVAEPIPTAQLSSAMNPVAAANKPTDVQAPAGSLTANVVTVNYTDNSPNEAKFQLERALVTGGTPGAYTIVAEGIPNVATLIDPTATASTTYSYRVRAFNFEGSAVSDPVTVTTPARTQVNGASAGWFDSPFWGAPTRPAQSDLKISASPDYREEWLDVINFNQPSLDRPGMGIVEGGTGNGRGQYSDVWTGKLIAPETGAFRILGFGDDDTHVWVDGQLASSDPGGHGRPANTAAGIATIDVRNPINLVQGQSYNFVILHAEGGGGSELTLRWITPSAFAATGETVATQVSAADMTNVSDLPVAPGPGGAETATATTAVINFQDNSKSELRYKVEQSRTADFAVIERTLSAPINGSSFAVTGLSPNTTYFFRITGTNLEGEGPSLVQQVTTSATNVPPAAPTNLVARTTNDRDFLLNWTDNANNETDFVITRRLNNTGDFVEVGTTGPNVTTFSDQVFPAPPRNTPVTYRVASRNGEGTSTPVEMTVLSGFPGGTGLTATAYATVDFTDDPNNPNDPKVYLDPEIGENWSLGPPVAGIPEDGFSIVWSGQLLAEKTEPYTFQIQGDDNFELIITDATTGAELVNLPLGPSGTARNSTPVPLVANTRYNIGLRYSEPAGGLSGAGAFLRWSSTTTAQEIIPQVFLFPTATAGTPVNDVYVRGSAWTTAFKTYLESKSLGDDVYGYKLLSNGAAVGAPAGNPDQVLPWINVDEIVLKYAQAPTGSGVPTTGNVTVVGNTPYTVTAVNPVAGDPTAFVLTLGKPLGGGNPTTGVAPTPAENGDHITLGVAGGGAGGSNLSLRMNVLQGDTDHTGETGGQHSVLAADFSAVKKKFFKDTTSPVTGTDVDYSVFHDVNGSGSILANDFSEVKKRFFQNLAPAAAPASALFSSTRIAEEVLK